MIGMIEAGTEIEIEIEMDQKEMFVTIVARRDIGSILF